MKPLSVPSQLTFKQQIPVHHPRSFSPPLPRAGKSPKPPEGSLASAQKERRPASHPRRRGPAALCSVSSNHQVATKHHILGRGGLQGASSSNAAGRGGRCPSCFIPEQCSLPTTTHAHTQKSRLPFCRPLLRVTGISNLMSSLLQQMAKWPWAAASPTSHPKRRDRGKAPVLCTPGRRPQVLFWSRLTNRLIRLLHECINVIYGHSLLSRFCL